MTQGNGTSGQKGKDTSFEDAVFRGAMYVGLLIATPLIAGGFLMGYLLVSAYRDRREARWVRAGLVFTFMAVATWFLVGPPVSLTKFARARAPGPGSEFMDLATYWARGVWQGLVFEQFSQAFGRAARWLFLDTLHLKRVTLSGAYDFLRILVYLPILASPVAAYWLHTKNGWKKPGVYRALRKGLHLSMAPLLIFPSGYAFDGKRARALLSLLAGVAVFGGLAFVLTPGPLLDHAWFMGFMAYLGVGLVYGHYQVFFGREYGRGAARVWGVGDAERVVFGRDLVSGNPAHLSIADLEHHVQVVGASGYGKSTFLSHLIAHHVRHGLGLIFVDLKADADTVPWVAGLCDAEGRLGSLKLLDLSRPELSLAYNPCRRGNATEVKDKLVGAFTWESEYYKNVAQSFLLTLLRGLVYLRDQAHFSFTLDDIHAAVVDPDSILALEVALNLAQAPLEIREGVNRLASNLRSRDAQKELQGLRTQLELLLHSEFGACLKSDRLGIDFFESIRDQDVVYVLLDSQTYGETAKKLGKLILQDLKSCSGEISTRIPATDRRHATIVVDEFADLVTEQFVGLLNRARSSRLGVVIAHQEVADLEAAGIPGLRDQVMSNTSTTVAFLQKSPESAERVASLAGTQTTTKRTRQVAEEGILFRDRQYTGVESEREVEEFVIHPNLIKRLEKGECVMIGKHPKHWHARVRVYPGVNHGQEMPRSSAAAASQKHAMQMLLASKAILERQAAGSLPLSLSTRSRELVDHGRKRRIDAPPLPGLTRESPAREEQEGSEDRRALAPDRDDRF